MVDLPPGATRRPAIGSTGSRPAVDGGKSPDEPVIDLGVLVAHSPGADLEAIESFADRTVADAAGELTSVTAADWQVHHAEPERLPDRGVRRPSEYLDEATLRMVEGPYDLLLVVTDVPLRSRRGRIVPGLASPIARIVVVSTHRLVIGPRDEPSRPLSSTPVRVNATTLMLHLLGHVLGAGHGDGGVMAPFRFDPSRQEVPAFDADAGGQLRRIAAEVPEEQIARGPLRRMGFHVLSAARNPGKLLGAILQSRAPLIPLSLPKLSAAAVTPTLIVVFSAEAWDVGMNMSNGTALFFAVASVFAAALHLTIVHDLRFPRRPRQVLTEHMALVNVTAFLVLLFAMVGLFVLVGAIILVIELAVFPANLMTNWPSLEDPTIGSVDLVRIGAFISTIGVLSGALAGGVENRAVVRHLALFLERP